ncbi:MAG: hypothetical protein KDB40_23940 [Acidimicrobiales bacterium]|nr:hypothetical protein [Acidimicrobiales bacterium]MCB9395836.1 hypothetical protein [Acidimicrobiaceae bacterium]
MHHSSRAFVPQCSSHLLARLQHEWLRLDRDPELLAHARTWQLPLGHVVSLDDLVDRCGRRTDGISGREQDDLLAAVVRIARHDELAARVALQRMLPPIAALGRRERDFVRRQEVLHELLTAAWSVIRTYPSERGHRCIAADLARRIRYVALERDRRRVRREDATPWWVFDLTIAPDADPAASDELDELLRDAEAAGVPSDELDLARRLGNGTTLAALAVEGRVTDRTMRNRRATMAHSLRAVARAS